MGVPGRYEFVGLLGVAVGVLTPHRCPPLSLGNRVGPCTTAPVQHIAVDVTTTRPNPEPMAAPDLVRREFTATGPNEIWTADIERHEALTNRAVVGGHRLVPAAAGTLKLRAT